MQCSSCKQQRLFLTKSAGLTLHCRHCGWTEKYHPPSYDHYHEQKYSYRRLRTPKNDPMLQKIITLFPDFTSRSSLLDYGCGAGDYAIHFSSISKHIVGVDRDIKQAKKSSAQVTWLASESAKIPLPSNSFDFVICVNVIEHMFNFDMTMKELHRVLKPGGKLFITTYDTNFILHSILYDSTHVYEWTGQEFTRYVGTYFSVLQSFNYGTFFNYYPANFLIKEILKPELCVLAQKH